MSRSVRGKKQMQRLPVGKRTAIENENGKTPRDMYQINKESLEYGMIDHPPPLSLSLPLTHTHTHTHARSVKPIERRSDAMPFKALDIA